MGEVGFMVHSNLIALTVSSLVLSCSPSRQTAKLNASVDITENHVIRRHLTSQTIHGFRGDAGVSGNAVEELVAKNGRFVKLNSKGELEAYQAEPNTAEDVSSAAGAKEPLKDDLKTQTEERQPAAEWPKEEQVKTAINEQNSRNMMLLLSNGFGPPRQEPKEHLVQAARGLIKKFYSAPQNAERHAVRVKGVEKRKALVVIDACWLKKSFWIPGELHAGFSSYPKLWVSNENEMYAGGSFLNGELDVPPFKTGDEEVRNWQWAGFRETHEHIHGSEGSWGIRIKDFATLEPWFCEDLSENVQELGFDVRIVSMIELVADIELRKRIFYAYLGRELDPIEDLEKHLRVDRIEDLRELLQDVDLLAVNGGNPDLVMYAFRFLCRSFMVDVKSRMEDGTLMYIARSAGAMAAGKDCLTPETDVPDGLWDTVVHQTMYRALMGDRAMVGFDQVHPTFRLPAASLLQLGLPMEGPIDITKSLLFRPHFGNTAGELAYMMLYKEGMADTISFQTCENNNGVLAIDSILVKIEDGQNYLLDDDPLQLGRRIHEGEPKIFVTLYTSVDAKLVLEHAKEICAADVDCFGRAGEDGGKSTWHDCREGGEAPRTATCVICWRNCIHALKKHPWAAWWDKKAATLPD